MKRLKISTLFFLFLATMFLATGLTATVSAYSTHADCESQYSPDWVFWQRSPQRQAQYDICVGAIDGQWGDISNKTGYEKCSSETYKYQSGLTLAYDYPAILKSCMFGIYGEELSENPDEKDVLDDVDDQVEDETLTRGPGWSEYNLETYCEGYKEDKEAGTLKDEYSCARDTSLYRLYLYNGDYYAEYIGPELLPQKCEDKFSLGWFVCNAAELISGAIDSMINNLLLPMLQWRVLV